MQLSNAINQVIRQFGRKALPTPGFVNIVADLGGFRDTPPASKKVMRGLLESGFGELLYRLSGERPDNWQ
ncbi:MAG: hypothetical protein K2F87_03565, partial [Muribaculaceae bacterium]|nr:hypothetical protein [Muribaculaceae bacterium]